MESVETRASSTPMIVGIIGGVALAIGSFLTWATVSVNFDKIATALGLDPDQIPANVRAQGTASVTGWKGGDGKWTLVAGVAVVVAAVLLMMATSRRILGIVMLVGGFVGGGLALYDATIQKNDVIDNASSQFSNIGLPGSLRDYFTLSLGIGIWLCVAGGVLAIAAGIMAMMSKAPVVAAASSDDPSGFTPPPPLASDAGFGTSGVGGSLMPAAAAPVMDAPADAPAPSPEPSTTEPPASEAVASEPPAVEPPASDPPAVEPPASAPPASAPPPSAQPPAAPGAGSGTGLTPAEDPPGTT